RVICRSWSCEREESSGHACRGHAGEDGAMSKPVVRTFVDNATDNGLQQDSGVVAATPLGDFYAVWRDSGNFNSGHADIGSPTYRQVRLVTRSSLRRAG